MNREQRLRRQIPGADQELITQLAARPADEVDLVVRALRQARRDALAHDKSRRAQRRADARSHRWYDEAQLAKRNNAVLSAQGKRAQEDLEALGWLAESRRHADRLIAMAVEGLRSRGLSDADIGSALGITKQGVQKRFQRQPELSAETRNGDPPGRGSPPTTLTSAAAKRAEVVSSVDGGADGLMS
jgi:hypothetical protein